MQSLQFYACPVGEPSSCPKQGRFHCKNWGYEAVFLKKKILKKDFGLWETEKT